VPGKCFCSRALLEKDYVRKHIEREHTYLRSSLQIPKLLEARIAAASPSLKENKSLAGSQWKNRSKVSV